MKYRKEIDGLRAVAVLPVILFHAGFEWFRGGYVGVDVFFVISGYLITSIIISEKTAGTFTIASFYERRARRILPALFFVVAVSIPFAWAWMLPHQLKDFAQSIIAVCLFLSNVLFYWEEGYFAAAAELKPLLHTWSLAVEEQFYVIFPVAVIVTWRLGRRAVIGLIVAVGLLSLAAAQFGGNFTAVADGGGTGWKWFAQPGWASFYLATGRAWELMIGALAAFYLASRDVPGSRLGGAAAAAGLLLIVYSVFAFNSATPFPSIYTLVPTIGTVLIILFAGERSLVGRLLSLPVLVGIGLISYSAYLWHQPLFAFARIRLESAPGPAVYLGLAGVALLLAFGTWKYVEAPFRNRRNFTARQIFTMALAASAVLISLGTAGHLGNGFTGRLTPEAQALLAYRNSPAFQRRECDAGMGEYRPPADRCTVGASDAVPRMAIVGDSHARELGFYLGERAEELGIGVKVLVHSGCAPIADMYRVSKPDGTCSRNNREVLEYLSASDDIETIVLAARWTLSVEVDRFDNGEGGKEQGEPVYLAPVGTLAGALNKEQTRAAVEARMRATIERYLGIGKNVIVVYPVPEVGWDVPTSLARASLSDRQSDTYLSTSYARYLERNARSIAVLDSFADHARFFSVRPAAWLCDKEVPGRCIAQRDGVPLYVDDDHLNRDGSQPIIDRILELAGR